MMKNRLLLTIGLWGWLAASAFAAVTQNAWINLQTPRADEAQIVNGSSTVTLTATTNYLTLATAGTNGTLITGLYCTSSDTVTHNIVVARVNGSNIYPLAVLAISAGSATALGTISSNPLSAITGLPVDPFGNPVLALNGTDTLKIGVLTTAVTSGDSIACMDSGGDF